MTPDNPMTPEQKQIAIAEFEGWKQETLVFDEEDCAPSLGIYPGENIFWFFNGKATKQLPPPYLTSRDAICGAVARLDDGQKRAFANMLYDLITGEKPNQNGYHLNRIDILTKDMVSFLLATPAQLSDALLLTLGYKL